MWMLLARQRPSGDVDNLVKESAISFPGTPLCSGIRINAIAYPTFISIEFNRCILLTKLFFFHVTVLMARIALNCLQELRLQN